MNDDAIEKLLNNKFGNLYNWKKPLFREAVGPYLPEAFDKFEARRIMLIEECRAFLTKISIPDLAILFHSDFDDPEEKRSAWDEFLRSEINNLTRRRPNWIAGGFGHPDFEADFKYWGQMAEYTLHEALILSVGVEPKHIGEKTLDAIAKKTDQDKIFPAFQYLVKRREQFRRKFPIGYSGWFPISPKDLKAWFDEISLDVHKDFYAELQRHCPKPKAKAVSAPKQNLAAQERETLLKLIAAMACEQYNFDPIPTRSSATSSIRDDIETVGLSMDNKTIRKWLNEAVALVPNDYWKK